MDTNLHVFPKYNYRYLQDSIVFSRLNPELRTGMNIQADTDYVVFQVEFIDNL